MSDAISMEGSDAAPPKKGMILAAGLGTRLRPLTEHLPKCMVPISGKPLLAYTVEWLARAGTTDLMINLSHLPQAVMDHFGDGFPWGARITYSLEPQPLGTAGGVRKVAWFLDGPFVVWYGDNLSFCDLRRLYAHHCSRGGIATIALYERDDPKRSGIASLEADDRITRFFEKPLPHQVFSHWVNAGIFVLEPAMLGYIPAAGTPDFGRDVFPAAIRSGARLYGYRLSAAEGLWWIDTPADLRRVEEQFRPGDGEQSLAARRSPQPGGQL